MIIRFAEYKDLDRLVEIENICFPKAEAAQKEQIQERLLLFGSHFLVAQMHEDIVGFINGMVTDEHTIRDEMYERASMHKEQGSWQSVFGLDVLPAYQRNGIASQLMEAFVEMARKEGRTGCILTCKEKLKPFYEKFGFYCLGVSQSVHGNVQWFDMVLDFRTDSYF